MMASEVALLDSPFILKNRELFYEKRERFCIQDQENDGYGDVWRSVVCMYDPD